MSVRRWGAIAFVIAVILGCFAIEIVKWGGNPVLIAIYIGPLVVGLGVAIWAHVKQVRARWPAAVCLVSGAPLYHMLMVPLSNILRALSRGDALDRISAAGMIVLFVLTVYALIVKPTPPPPDRVARAVATE